MSIDTHSISSGSSSALYEKDDTDIKTRHFLCIPVRYGLLSCSALLFLVASAFAALGASLAHSTSFRKLSDDIERITVILHVAAFSIASLIALLGIYAAIARSQLLLSIGSGVLSLYLLYGPNSKDAGTDLAQNVCNGDEQGSEETDVDCTCQGMYVDLVRNSKCF
ncbi:hypothetical protein BDQ12DRAFT_667943 [Crucibulum laeve]|uniref:Uncharacterized protein n=1 Tax=Crucibulum laeve TaxID=68775 RepID=A0A5C3LV17_9AGAR|nr:hypothetical protein BDQ12DRAFT_667943 [Crucibulum laeve]